MEHFISNIYGLNDIEWIPLERCFLIKSKEKNYYLYEVDNIDQVYFQYQLSIKYPFFWKFLFNNNHSILTLYQDKYFVLLEKGDKKNNFLDQLLFIPFSYKWFFGWREKWIKKSDFLYEYYNNIKGKYTLIDESFDYYYGLMEYAIFLLRDYNNYSSFSFIQHSYFNIDEYYNPLYLMVDIKERDFSEYLKYLFFSNHYKDFDFNSLFKSNQNINYDYNLVFARLFYPNYYFDLVNDIIEGNKSLNDLEIIISKNMKYEKYLKYIYESISYYYPIKKISFFEK